MKVVRPPHMAEQVVFVDGLPGCGKTMLSPIVGALARVELMQYAYPLEYATALHYLGNLAPDGAVALVRMLTDLQLYNVMMSRETNFRWSDLSSVRMHPEPWKYLRRLFQTGDAAAATRIERERPILHLVTHLLFIHTPLLLEALGGRGKMIEVVRHPLYMIKQQLLYMDRFASDPRDFSIWIDAGSGTVPWFALGWEEKFQNANAMDRAIYMVDEMGHRHQAMLAGLTAAERAQVLMIPFERFVIDPWPYMEQLATLLGTQVTDVTRREMKKQKVPRTMYADGIGRPIYAEYGWQPPSKGSDEAREFAVRRAFAAETATPEAMVVLDRLSAEYERQHLYGTAAEAR